jgi:hypothetical protein
MKPDHQISRRTFLKTLSLVAAAPTLGCAITETKSEQIASSLSAIKPQAVGYPKLAGQKIQPPENGCLIGMRRAYARSNISGFNEFLKILHDSRDFEDYENRLESSKWRELFKLEEAVKSYAGYYREEFNQNPKILGLIDTPKLFRPFPSTEASIVSTHGMIPYINMLPCHYNRPKIGFSLESIVSGKQDKYLKLLAEGATKFGEKYNGFFLTTMEENNGNWYYWGQNPKFVPAWRHIWQIFEEQGANEFATWVWEICCPETTGNVAKPEDYYPGDKYVDWVGISAFWRGKYRETMLPFDDLVGRIYNRMRKNFPNKPIMQAEFGKTNAHDQANWLINAYTSIKKDFPALKAEIYYDNVTFQIDDDHVLNKKSLEALKEVFKDPYWIMAK